MTQADNWKPLYRTGAVAALTAALLFRRNIDAEVSLFTNIEAIPIRAMIQPQPPQPTATAGPGRWFMGMARPLTQATRKKQPPTAAIWRPSSPPHKAVGGAAPGPLRPGHTVLLDRRPALRGCHK